ncbi:unnamed protein product [Dovyalis caffra]|uniref:Uncharacterized protein n=1 Tax=Dovyalis caffra TaxID=77055 RepID=A0AAV1R8Q3_9ROSI|nr:unnamed protein product [Dovyalis caffra]
MLEWPPESSVGHTENPSLADSRRPAIGEGLAVLTSLAGAPSEVVPFDPMVSEVGAATSEWILVFGRAEAALARIGGAGLGELRLSTSRELKGLEHKPRATRASQDEEDEAEC